MKNIEQEFKWNAASARAFEHFVQTARPVCTRLIHKNTQRITDYYLDNKSGDFSANQVALRIRHNRQCWEATLKSRTCLKKGLAVRQEFTLALKGVRSLRGAMVLLNKRRKWKGVPVINLQERFRIRNSRRLYHCSYKNICCELALDDYVTFAAGHQLRRREIELELKKGNNEIFKQLVEKLSVNSGLQPAKISKVAGAEKWISQKFSLN